MNRQELKFDAKEKMRQASVNPYVVTIIMLIIVFILSVIQVFIEFWGGLMDDGFGSQSGTFIIIVFGFFIVYLALSTILQFGYNAYCLKVANRDSSMSYGDLFSPAGYFLKAIGLMFMMSILIFLWSILFVIPGIIAACRYSQAVFIMIENPQKGIMQCIKESKEMMDGHKMEYLILELSFILWMLLGSATCGLALIYVYPYMTVTLANYYNSLKPVSVIYREAEVVN